MSTSPTRSDWRERKKAATRRSVQEHAMRLFLEKGYEATTVEEIAAAAGVSHMTFFRYYPTKEHVASTDDYDPLIVGLIMARPAEESTFEKIRNAFMEGLSRVYKSDREALLVRNRLILRTPALRARLWENQGNTQRVIVDALIEQSNLNEDDLAIRVVVAASLAAAATAVLAWAENDDARELPDLVDEAFTALRDAAG